ncbi:MAG: hypothetical protein HY392_03565 [Candidatus Diapherotrites archaeon]|nr:hypothetical protein [Candidatus Diapherotrites archaeon]
MKLKINKSFVEIKKGYCNLTSVPATIKSLSEAAKKLGGFAQAVDASCVVSDKQVLAALLYAFGSFELLLQAGGLGRLKSPGLEFLLALTATRQLKDAISICGLREGKSPCILVVCAPGRESLSALLIEGEKLVGFSEKKILAPDSEKIRGLFRISAAELGSMRGKKNALELLVLEKMALSRL